MKDLVTKEDSLITSESREHVDQCAQVLEDLLNCSRIVSNKKSRTVGNDRNWTDYSYENANLEPHDLNKELRQFFDFEFSFKKKIG